MVCPYAILRVIPFLWSFPLNALIAINVIRKYEMKHIKRFLVTTADERSWKFDCPVLFLGEWCQLYERKQVWEGMDAAVAAPYGLRVGQKDRDLAYMQVLSTRLLSELAVALNAYHHTSHSLRYWQIVLGRWLMRYVAVTFNRYYTLEQALNNYEVSGTTVFESAGYNLATADSLTFVHACNDDIWNHVIYSRILNYWGQVKIEPDFEPLRGVSGFASQKVNSKFVKRTTAKRLALYVANKILPKFSREHDAFIIGSYLPRTEEIKLQLSLLQCPQLWRSPPLGEAVHDEGKRRRFRLDTEGYHGFERFIRLYLPEILPVCYLEGYSQLVQQVESLLWPKKPKFIYTANNFDTDEIFKIWTGSKVEKGVPYIAGQHGNNYGTHVYWGNQYGPEQAAADKFLTWGWTNDDPKNIPAFVFTIAGRKFQRWNPKGGLLLVEWNEPDRCGPEDDYFEFGIYQEEQFRLVDLLPETIRQKLVVRLHPDFKNRRWSEQRRWKDRSPNTKIGANSIPLQNLIAQSRLVICSYDSTAMLETLAQNIPILCYWQGGLNHLRECARPYYEKLQEAGLLMDSAESTAKKVAEVWNDIPAWWHGEEVQNARRLFCDQYARTSGSPVKQLRKILTSQSLRE